MHPSANFKQAHKRVGGLAEIMGWEDEAKGYSQRALQPKSSSSKMLSPGGVAHAMKVTLATSTATIPMEGMPILYACFEVKPVATATFQPPDMLA